MSELLDEKSLMNEKRGATIKVLAILSWVWIGLGTLMTLPGIFTGPMTPEQLEDAKVEILSMVTPESQKILGPDFMKENIAILERTNELHYSIMGLNISSYILGFYAVFLMYNLKKKGFYLYVVYSLIPVISPLLFFEPGPIRSMTIGVWLFLASIFCILYGVQTKRMA
jgi:hypothetical protein